MESWSQMGVQTYRWWAGREIVVNGQLVWRGKNYSPEICNDLLEYFDTTAYELVFNKVSGKMERQCKDFPTFEWFRAKVGIPNSTWRNWVNSYPELQEAVELAKDRQWDILRINGLNGTYNSSMAKFVGMNDLGMSEKSEVRNVDNDVISEAQKKKLLRQYLEDIKDWEVLEITDVDEET